MAHVGVLTAICLLLFTGAIGKSAQLPLYVWLPDAMEGPTPVSALIHAATMVTAGVYMVARMNPLFSRAPIAMLVVAIVGAVTAFYAATIGLVQTDIKKVLAYSTVSQLGYMFLACGVGAYAAGIFHLMTHAFFKGLLFLAAGSVIHAMGGEQDMLQDGRPAQENSQSPIWTMLIATLAIAGIPGFAGFFSKDEILEAAHSGPHANMCALAARRCRRGTHVLLHVPADLPHVFRQAALRRASRPRARIAAEHDRAADDSRVAFDRRRLVRRAATHGRHRPFRSFPCIRFSRRSAADSAPNKPDRCGIRAADRHARILRWSCCTR